MVTALQHLLTTALDMIASRMKLVVWYLEQGRKKQ